MQLLLYYFIVFPLISDMVKGCYCNKFCRHLYPHLYSFSTQSEGCLCKAQGVFLHGFYWQVIMREWGWEGKRILTQFLPQLCSSAASSRSSALNSLEFVCLWKAGNRKGHGHLAMSNSVGICKVGLLEAWDSWWSCNTLSWLRVNLGLECAVEEQLPLQELALFLSCLQCFILPCQVWLTLAMVCWLPVEAT